MKKLYFERSFFLFLILSLLSCKTIYFKELEFSPTQKLRGKISSIKASNYRFANSKSDKPSSKDSIIVYFDKNNNLEQQIDFYQNTKDKTYFYYNQFNLIKEQLSYDEASKRYYSKITYSYDKKKKLIEYRQYENDILIFSKSFERDKKGNPVKILYKRNDKIDVELLSNDYKKRTVKINKSNDTINYVKYYYDKKGRIISSEIKSNNLQPITGKIFYDKRGNITKNLFFDVNNKPKDSSVYHYIFDAKKNIIYREHTFKNKLLEKSTYNIIYR